MCLKLREGERVLVSGWGKGLGKGMIPWRGCTRCVQILPFLSVKVSSPMGGSRLVADWDIVRLAMDVL